MIHFLVPKNENDSHRKQKKRVIKKINASNKKIRKKAMKRYTKYE